MCTNLVVGGGDGGDGGGGDGCCCCCCERLAGFNLCTLCSLNPAAAGVSAEASGRSYAVPQMQSMIIIDFLRMDYLDKLECITPKLLNLN